MDDWQQNWWEILEKTALDVEELMEDIGNAVELFTDEVGEKIEDFVEQLQDSLVSEIDKCVEDIFGTLINTNVEAEIVILEDIDYADNLDYFSEELDFIGIHKENPNLDKNPACIGCQHYHGRIYSGNLLVCGMHPYGWTDDNCPDWEDKQ